MGTCKPTTLGELQLLKVLQRANLLAYYEAFISQGGDDVQQLCEAGEEEFLEIMALVGMASKPLHVRRLQKALQEWVTRPDIFRGTDISYLPAQSISLTSLGIDAQELIPPVLNSSSNSSTFNRPASTAPPGQDVDILNRSLNTAQSSKSPKGPENTHSQRNHTSRALNGNNFEKDQDNSYVGGTEREDSKVILKLIEVAVRRLIKHPTTLNEKDVISKLQADGKHDSLVAALECKDEGKLEAEVQNFVKFHMNSDGAPMSRHELLLNEAAVKLCMSDTRYLLKEKDLMVCAESIASEVENKLSRRRSSSHLHGSCSQTRMQEINNQLRDIKAQRANFHKKLSEAKSSKNISKENDCQSHLSRVAKEEVLLLKERNELSDKLQNENRESSSRSPHAEKSFSAELADLAKAHNLSLGNFHPPVSTSPWASQESAQKLTPDGCSNEKLVNSEVLQQLPDSPAYNSSVSPPRIENIDFENIRPSAGGPPSLIRVKMEDEDDDATHCFPSKPITAVVHGIKRKHASGEGKSLSKKTVNSQDRSSE